ncbi:hypothetical protein KUCAC02_005569 [Chaenocephalus aceratus]|uniref:Uncharacterized protein n=1 Tax=Chaenocephalus aceratus TaxID=36190 RepID=A0ACB9WP08_CHAAC|nr:hypothetical protein KUCAC02_005569 [Chaenocephalus aceratus]
MESNTQRSPLSSWRDCFVLKRIRMLAPVGFKTEIKELCTLAGPVVLSHLMAYTLGFVSAIFCGHLGTVELAGVSLATSVLSSKPVNSASQGLNKRYKMVPLHLKVTNALYQSIIWPPVITGLIVNILNAVIQYIFIFVLHQGIAGSAAANAISQYCMATTLFAYIIWKDLHKPTWGGWTKECLQDWGSYMYLAIPSMVMMCVEWWSYEIGSLLAGLISEVELGAQSIVLNSEQEWLGALQTQVHKPEDPGDSQDSAGTDTVELVDLEAGGAAVSPGEEELSLRSLLLRRGLVLTVMLFILAAGIIINLLINNLVT